MDYGMIGFINTHAAICAQKLLTPHVPIQTMPVLREVSTGCGIAVRFAPQYRRDIQAILAASPLQPEEYTLYLVRGMSVTRFAEDT